MNATRPAVRRSGLRTSRRRTTARVALLVRLLAIATALCAGAPAAGAAPEAHLLRIDPRAGMTEGEPIVTTVVELVAHKPLSELTARCAMHAGDAQLDCLADLLEQPGALYTSFEFPSKNATLRVTIDGADRPAAFESSERWGESVGRAGVGTAWLLLLDGSASMATRFVEARALASAFVDAMGPADLVDIMIVDDRTVVHDSRWLADRARARAFIDAATRVHPSHSRTRPLAAILKGAATEAFGNLGKLGTAVEVPLHQAMVVLSSGWAGGDSASVGPAALAVAGYLTRGRFPEDDATTPRVPVPIASIWLPSRQIEEVLQSSRQFMEQLANPSIGGFYSLIREGQPHRVPRVVSAVRTRFDQMHLVRWRLSCVAPTVSQTFKLLFQGIEPPVVGDQVVDVPFGIEPTLWPLDVDVARSVAAAHEHRLVPGGTVRIFGNFCWGNDASRARLYLVPKGQPLPPALRAGDLEQARDAQGKLTQSDLVGQATAVGDGFVEFSLPSSAKFLVGKGSKMVARMVVYDSGARRSSALGGNAILTLAARQRPLNLWLVGGLTFAGLVLLLLVVPVLRGGTARRRRGASAGPAGVSAPEAPSASPGVEGAGASPAPVRADPATVPSAPAVAGLAPLGASAGPSEQGGGDTARLAPLPGRVTRATLSGPTGTYDVAAAVTVRVGRDPGISEICLTEPRVSAQHAILRLDAGELRVRDEGSNNGTFVAGYRIAAGVWTPVPHGVQLKFGPIEFTVRLE